MSWHNVPAAPSGAHEWREAGRALAHYQTERVATAGGTRLARRAGP